MDLTARLSDALLALDDEAAIVAQEPSPSAPTRSGLRRLLPTRANGPRHIQVVRDADRLMAEAHGFERMHAQVARGLGWVAPGHPDAPPHAAHHARTFPVGDAEVVARHLVRTLDTMGVDLESVELRTG